MLNSVLSISETDFSKSTKKSRLYLESSRGDS